MVYGLLLVGGEVIERPGGGGAIRDRPRLDCAARRRCAQTAAVNRQPRSSAQAWACRLGSRAQTAVRGRRRTACTEKARWQSRASHDSCARAASSCARAAWRVSGVTERVLGVELSRRARRQRRCLALDVERIDVCTAGAASARRCSRTFAMLTDFRRLIRYHRPTDRVCPPSTFLTRQNTSPNEVSSILSFLHWSAALRAARARS